MARFVVSLYSEFDNRSGIGVFDTELGLQYLQLEPLADISGLQQLRGVCQVGSRLYVSTPCSLRIYSVLADPRPEQSWFELQKEVILPEWVLGRRPNADLLAIHYCPRRERLLVACNALASIDELDLDGNFLARKHLWEVAPALFLMPGVPTNRTAFGHVRGIAPDEQGDPFLTVAFKNGTESGCLVRYADGALLADDLHMPHSGLWMAGRYYVLDVKRGRLVMLPSGSEEGAIEVPARVQSFAARRLKANLRGLGGADDALYAGLFNFELEEKKKIASQIVCFALGSGQQERLYDLPPVAGFRFPAPFAFASFAGGGEVAGGDFILQGQTEAVISREETPAVVHPKPRPASKAKASAPASGEAISAPVIEVRNVSLSYRRGMRLGDWLGRARRQEFKALDDVSLELREGEVLGLIGRNGSGKSTMGMLLAGILEPDAGRVERHGRVQLLSLGVGFNNELSGRENVQVNASLLGLSRKQVAEHLDEIVAFAEIGDFIDEPMRTYSAGMRSRLAFAIATVIKPDVLILDEVLSTGDDSFRRKAETRMREMKGKAKCVVMVSHSGNQIRKLCTRVVWLEKGHLILDGKPKQVMPEYEAFCQSPDKWLHRHPHIAARLRG